MADIALREMIRALRSKSPGIGLKKLTAEIRAVLPESMAPAKKTVKEICQQIDGEDQLGTQNRTRDDNFSTRIRAAFEMFRDAERAYLLASDGRTIKSDAPAWYAASQLRHYFEVLLTLKGKKPCTLVAMASHEGSVMLNGMVLQCLAPMIQQFELESYAFTLRYLAHDVLTSQPAHPGFKGSWIFADQQSQKWNEVQDIFLMPHPGRRNPEVNIGAALGYPAVPGYGTVWYIDDTETSELQRITGDEVDKVIGMEFFNGQGGFARAITHYHECKKAVEDVGVRLQIEIDF
ncbi:hypothetical protein GGS26DRAFT_294490 [Hypomontagnella submonticulosa]|nr:hypothetical protein GGS26DRAFT_294490 [Hypomontagnella submonticulosa]